MLELLAASVWMTFMTIFGMRGQSTEPEIPKDPVARSKHLASHCLSILKAELSQARIVELQQGRVSYRAPRSALAGELWCEDGRVKQQIQGGQPKTVCQLGDLGSLSFEKTSDQQLAISIVASPAANVSHRVSLRLSVTAA